MSATITRKNPNALKKAMARLEQLKHKEIAVGFPQGKCQAYGDGTSVAYVAAINTYGWGVPQRDFMAMAKPGIIEKTKPYMQELAQQRLAGGDVDLDVIRNAAGQIAQAEIRQAIIDMKTPPNAPSTIAHKHGVDNPLQDTNHMLQSVTYIIRERKK